MKTVCVTDSLRINNNETRKIYYYCTMRVFWLAAVVIFHIMNVCKYIYNNILHHNIICIMNIRITCVGLYTVSIKNLVGWRTLYASCSPQWLDILLYLRSHESLFEFVKKLGRRNYWPEIIVFCHFKLVHKKKKPTTTIRDGLISYYYYHRHV